jgi:transglutaminase-like putative cysteine protease
VSRFLATGFLLLGATLTAGFEEPMQLQPDREPHSRAFTITCSGAVTGLKPDQAVRVWLPVPSSGDDQEVTLVERGVPGGGQLNTDPVYRNPILYFDGKADADGKVPYRLVCRVYRHEVLGARCKEMEEEAKLLARFLQADARVPLDGKPQDLIKGRKLPDDPLSKARLLYDVVNAHMRYSKEGIGWGQGDAIWACENGYGNCSDFHSLFIALARAQKIPAKFEIGFPLPVKRGEGEITGYHCWAKFRVKGLGWVPVDISEASKDPSLKDYYFGNLTEDRVAFSTGRDIDLVPKQAGPPLNFFVHPYAEADGKPLPKGQVKLKVSYKDESK